jgi:hypothetical protein
MAQFKYLGEPPRPGLVKQMGQTLMIRVPMKDGRMEEFPAPDASGWKAGDVISKDGVPYDFTDERSIRCLRADIRYEEV